MVAGCQKGVEGHRGRGPSEQTLALAELAARIRTCRVCVEHPLRKPLPHAPRPIIRVTRTARLAVFSQAPGLRAHEADVPFKDPSGVRLREWMGISEVDFYNPALLAIAPMGFCFPGYDAKGGDLPPRKECAPLWRDDLVSRLEGLQLALLVGGYAQAWHLGARAGVNLTETVRDHARILAETEANGVAYLPLPHPSWRNNGWLKANPWFARDLLPDLRRRVRACLNH